MALASDEQNIIEVITLVNLANLAAPQSVVIIPPGLENLYLTSIQNYFSEPIGLFPDISQLAKTRIVSGEATIIAG